MDMDREHAQTIILNRNFALPDSGDSHKWAEGMTWQQYHENVYDAIIPQIKTMELFIDTLIGISIEGGEDEEWAKNQLWDAVGNFLSFLSRIEPTLGNLHSMTYYHLAKAELEETK